ncbi:hypothetical protein IWQ62_000445 [Dispira parvispora]|uniref:Molybdenum cofactor sulfurase n=1 Tax=Dispira parvispora TaxID=1520584 RepID=A0A9W8B0N4_9FUNG|nr:hypothetical protein IWQ62_000445 [Dispira parvispora]
MAMPLKTNFNETVGRHTTDQIAQQPVPSQITPDFITHHQGLYYQPVDRLVTSDFSQQLDCVYLDHAGAAIPSQVVIGNFTKHITTGLFGNPHSQNPASQRTAYEIQRARTRILDYLGTDELEYSVIFTTNATAALKLAGEMFPWTAIESSTGHDIPSKGSERKQDLPIQANGSQFWYHQASHTSVVGLRNLVRESGVSCCGVTGEMVSRYLENPADFHSDDLPNPSDGTSTHLFAYPAQCNFSGARLPLDWSKKFQTIRRSDPSLDSDASISSRVWWVLLDAASYVTTSALNLAPTSSACSPDLVAMSFYKTFGFPTGLGALVVRNCLAPYVRKRYFGGGSVTATVFNEPWQAYRTLLHEKFEDGTVNFFDIIALNHAFDRWNDLWRDPSFLHPSYHVGALTVYLLRRMVELRHYNGQPLCVFYLSSDLMDTYATLSQITPALVEQWLAVHGAILNFNLRRSDQSWIGYSEVGGLAALNRIYIRAGGMCNPGALQQWLHLNAADIQSNFKQGHVCWDDRDLIGERPTGSIRLSLGWTTRFEDIHQWLQFLETHFLETCPVASTDQVEVPSAGDIRLVEITIFPIKSCHGMPLPSGQTWPLTPHGLLHDREWSLVDARTGRALSQKQYPRMCLIQPVIDRHRQRLLISAPGLPDLSLDLTIRTEEYEHLDCQVCGDQMVTHRYQRQGVTRWFSTFFGFPCYLARQISTPSRSMLVGPPVGEVSLLKFRPATDQTQPLMLFANESPFLLISQSSVQQVSEWVTQRQSPSKTVVISQDRFRANFVITGNQLAPFQEDHHRLARIGGQYFELVKPCTRCHMVCIDQDTGKGSREPFSTLSIHRRSSRGKIHFGQHLRHMAEKSALPFEVQVGASVEFLNLDESHEY